MPRADSKISFIVLFHGGPDHTFSCLMSIAAAADRDALEIILVDNGSIEADRRDLNRRLSLYGFSLDRTIRLPKNVGFARGMNAGIEVATGALVVALNSDTVVGPSLANKLFSVQTAADVAFLAVPVYDLEITPGEERRTPRLQAELTALTCYISCLPVRASVILGARILGPPGAAIIMTRAFIRVMQDSYGFVFNPDFFLYGEDVDLFLRSRRHGFRTQAVPLQVEQEEAIWHIGSASSSGSKRTIDKSPELAAYVLSGCLRNIWGHAGWAELLPLLALHVCFRVVFYGIYLQKQSWRPLLALLRAPSQRTSYRRRETWLRPIFLWPLITLFYQQPLPWARRKSAALQPAVLEKA